MGQIGMEGTVSILVVGSVALDSVKTPFGHREDALGGSATYFSTSASFFTDIKLVGVVGSDFPKEHVEFLQSKKVDTAGLEITDGKTFRWAGKYEFDMNEAHTLETQLNAFETFKPKIPDSHKKIPYLFLANINPELQIEVLKQVNRPKFVACDTMNLWIEIKKPALLELIGMVDAIILNEGEARMLTGQPSLVKSAKEIASCGPKHVVIKKGEHGAIYYDKASDSFFMIPAYPLEEVFDPTGAGDTFAGGFMGYIAKEDKVDRTTIKKAIVYGTIMASFNVEQFSLDRLATLTHDEIEQRYKTFQDLCHF